MSKSKNKDDAKSRLDISVPGLRDTILNDKETLENIILAQNGFVLVNVRFYENFLGRLKSEGYLF